MLNRYQEVVIKSPPKSSTIFQLTVTPHAITYVQKSAVSSRRVTMDTNSRIIRCNHEPMNAALVEWFKEKIIEVGHGLSEGTLRMSGQ